jgi:hypothetical protein
MLNLSRTSSHEDKLDDKPWTDNESTLCKLLVHGFVVGEAEGFVPLSSEDIKQFKDAVRASPNSIFEQFKVNTRDEYVNVKDNADRMSIVMPIRMFDDQGNIEAAFAQTKNLKEESPQMTVAKKLLLQCNLAALNPMFAVAFTFLEQFSRYLRPDLPLIWKKKLSQVDTAFILSTDCSDTQIFHFDYAPKHNKGKCSWRAFYQALVKFYVSLQ